MTIISREGGDSHGLPGPDLVIARGRPRPLGATLAQHGINFAVFSSHATLVTLVLFLPQNNAAGLEVPLDPHYHRTGDVWHVFVQGLGAGIDYGYRVEGSSAPAASPRYSATSQLWLDPYARVVSGAEVWSRLPSSALLPSPWERIRPRRARVVPSAFAWGEDQPLHRPLNETVIYELHVRGFTQHPSSMVAYPGTFLGLVEKIPYLQELGITAVELMPVTEFEENDNPRVNPLTGEPLKNFWGYHPIACFAPKASYAATAPVGGQVQEFKTMVQALHAAGIEVILDLVFNHTGEGDVRCPPWSYRGLDNSTYYHMDPTTGSYRDYTGCGNTLNCNHPVVRDLIVDCLRYWVTEMHVDGFRFDLAAVFSRGQDGTVLEQPPLVERIAADPILARTKLIAEPWDAAGLYQVGTFPRWGRWAEWNDKFRDDIRRFIRGDAGMVPLLATRLLGSHDLYAASEAGPSHSINFITSHDGFTLADLVTYNRKHNTANGEGEADGAPDDSSWNCGAEGPSTSLEVSQLRTRQMKNLATLLLLSQGVPMILGGDEMGRTQQGNNNPYCHDNEISWLDWGYLSQHADLFRFFQLLIRFRKHHPILRCYHFAASRLPPTAGIAWHGCRTGQPDWSWESRSLALHLLGGNEDVDLFLIANTHWECLTFELPTPSGQKQWYRFVDTLLEPPDDICHAGAEPPLTDLQHYKVGPRTVVVLVGK